MKNRLFLLVLLLFIVVFATDCQKEVLVTAVELNKSTLTVQVYGSEKLIATIFPEKATNKQLIYTSSNDSIATVASNGLVIGISKGVATITVTTVDGNFSATCTVEVNATDMSVTGVKLNKERLFLEVGNTEKLIPTIFPHYATNKTVYYTSSDPSIATVAPDGLVTVFENGISMVTVSTDDGNFLDSCLVVVGTISVIDVILNKTKLELKLDESEMLIATILPEYATNPAISWSIDNEEIATVYGGLVAPLTYGTTKITATTLDGNKTATCDLKVYSTIEELDMAFVQGGTFTMGCTNEQSDCGTNEHPAHQVTLSSFEISKYLITQKQWKEIMGSNNNPSTYQGDDRPVETISIYQMLEFIAKLNAATGKNYRLPTEAEWEYAARGGMLSKQYKYSGGDTINNVAWYAGNTFFGRSQPVGLKDPNELGVYDMSGNVWEMCSDWFGDYSEEHQTDPTGPPSGGVRTLRGGSFDSYADKCRVSTRRAFTNHSEKNTGFRVVLPVQ